MGCLWYFSCLSMHSGTTVVQPNAEFPSPPNKNVVAITRHKQKKTKQNKTKTNQKKKKFFCWMGRKIRLKNKQKTKPIRNLKFCLHNVLEHQKILISAIASFHGPKTLGTLWFFGAKFLYVQNYILRYWPSKIKKYIKNSYSVSMV